MTSCLKCRRPLRLPSPDGLGPKCRKAAKSALPASDLFGFRPEVFAQQQADKARIDIARAFAATLRRRMEALA